MTYRIAFPLLALAVAGGCSGTDASGPMPKAISPSASVSNSRAGGDDGAESSRRSGALHLAKECSTFTGQAGDHCTVVRTNVKAIPVGSKVFYLVPSNLALGTYDGDVELRVKPGNVAFGHCIVPDLFSIIPNTVIGHCVFSGGTGRFSEFSAQIVVSVDGLDPALADWDGAYSFSKTGAED
jgi:hypothetical protein